MVTDDASLIRLLGSVGGVGAIVGVLLLVIYRITSRIVERMIAAIDRVATNVATLDEREAARHANVREDLVKLDAKVSSALNWNNRERSDRIDRGENTPTGIPREPHPHERTRP